ncbi:DNA polymerase III epsilon subunit [hydrothermal vent metagenome]|uniref:DNA polymerase III subunit epsilon n=1 Tax=hydrothermal vent metagenome TaxID=652676 RepID=A0A3B0Y7F1_9ZZZZ
MMRYIVLDTETTGLEPKQGHRIIEIGCVEIINRKITDNTYHQYIQPDRESDEGAFEVHGISSEFLADKPRFADIVQDFMAYVDGGELVIHNAPFDIGFLDNELSLLGAARRSTAQATFQATVQGKMGDHCVITDSLIMARKMHPGQKNNLDALCKRYEVNNARRELHGALLDAELLAEVYLRMTGGQEMLALGGSDAEPGGRGGVTAVRRVDSNRPALNIIRASVDELEVHQQRLDKLGDGCVWNKDSH